jgi:hypothetical protein
MAVSRFSQPTVLPKLFKKNGDGSIFVLFAAIRMKDMGKSPELRKIGPSPFFPSQELDRPPLLSYWTKVLLTRKDALSTFYHDPIGIIGIIEGSGEARRVLSLGHFSFQELKSSARRRRRCQMDLII